jgi:hypothetical protein
MRVPDRRARRAGRGDAASTLQCQNRNEARGTRGRSLAMAPGPLDRWQEVGCGKYCFECPPTPERARLALFRCDEVADENSAEGGADGLSVLMVQRPDLLRLFRLPNPGLAGVGDFGPDPTDVVGQDWAVNEHDRALLAEVRS